VADKQTILVVEDDHNLAEMLTEFFSAQGYQVQTADWGEQAVKACWDNPPSIALLDIRLPDIDGFEVARRLLASRRTRHIPLIFLTEKRDRTDKLHGLDMGAVDYITKPFDIRELLLRVRNNLNRIKLSNLYNPVTGLPERVLVDERLGLLLNETEWATLLINLRGIEQFRELYGFSATDDVHRAVSLMLRETVNPITDEHEFLGHFTPESYLIITHGHRLQLLQEHILQRLNQSLNYFYPLKDRPNAERFVLGERLTTTIGLLPAPATPFSKLDELKTAILRSALSD